MRRQPQAHIKQNDKHYFSIGYLRSFSDWEISILVAGFSFLNEYIFIFEIYSETKKFLGGKLLKYQKSTNTSCQTQISDILCENLLKNIEMQTRNFNRTLPLVYQ